MIDRIKLALSFDPHKLQAETLGLDPAEWIDHFITQQYEGSWSVVPLRGPAHALDPVQMIYADPACTDFADAPILARLDYVREVLGTFQCDLESVRLMRLTPGSHIREHCDRDAAPELGRARLHVPIFTGPSVAFYVNRRPVVMREGECWYLRLSDPHSVRNDGDADRIHLVIDASVNTWLRALLESSAA